MNIKEIQEDEERKKCERNRCPFCRTDYLSHTHWRTCIAYFAGKSEDEIRRIQAERLTAWETFDNGRKEDRP